MTPFRVPPHQNQNPTFVSPPSPRTQAILHCRDAKLLPVLSPDRAKTTKRITNSKRGKKMQTINKRTDRNFLLVVLWIFLLGNLIYADILTLYFNHTLQRDAWNQFQSG